MLIDIVPLSLLFMDITPLSNANDSPPLKHRFKWCFSAMSALLILEFDSRRDRNFCAGGAASGHEAISPLDDRIWILWIMAVNVSDDDTS